VWRAYCRLFAVQCALAYTVGLVAIFFFKVGLLLLFASLSV
jgi:hypothetical protein